MQALGRMTLPDLSARQAGAGVVKAIDAAT
jgi:hypothetical protein